jgi:membrane fusion protein (multidrug efflux system)
MQTKLLFILLLTGFIACKGKKKEEPNKNKAPQNTIVDVLIAGTKSVQNVIEVNGTIIANEMVTLHPEISGRLTYLNVPDGKAVASGTLLAKINDAELQAQLNKSKVQLELAQKSEERLRKLLQINGINQADYDVALNNVNNIKADLELIKAQIDKTIIKAPFSGVLGLRQTSPGAYVTPQTIIATLQETNKIKLDFTIPEHYATLIKKGSTVFFTTTNNNTQRKATIIATEPEINIDTRNLKVRAIPEGSAISPGAFVKVYLKNGVASNHIVIPTSAIIPEASTKKVVIVKDGKGKFVEIKTGERTATGVEVLNGLTIGDSVVVTGVLFVRPNANLKVRSIKNLDQLFNEK